jgi:hypothetical protein
MRGTITIGGPGLRRAAVLLAVVLLLAGFFWLTPGEEDGFARSAPQMEAVARALGKDEVLGRRTIGVLTFDTVWWDGDTVVFSLSDSHSAYLWNPERSPGDSRHLWGPWYVHTSDPH